VSFVELVKGLTTGRHPDDAPGVPKELIQMFTIEEDSGTFTGSLRRHNGYYAGDFTRNPMCKASELSALAKLRPPASPAKSGHSG
jgi:hypothetical protein